MAAFPRSLVIGPPILLGLILLGVNPGVDLPSAPAVKAPSILLLDTRSSWADRAALSDPASLVLPALGSPPTLPDSAQPDATPFSSYPPLISASPEGTFTIPLRHTLPPASQVDPRALPELEQPLLTLGRRAVVGPPPASGPNCKALSLLGGTTVALLKIDPQDELHKLLSKKDLSFEYPLVFSLAIDAYGLQASPVFLVPTGSQVLDQAANRWVASQPWARLLPAGAYRLEIRP